MAVNDWVFDGGFHGAGASRRSTPCWSRAATASIIDEGSGIVSYDDLEGVAKGDEAAMLLLEYMRPRPRPSGAPRSAGSCSQYCELDTWATVEVLRVFVRPLLKAERVA